MSTIIKLTQQQAAADAQREGYLTELRALQRRIDELEGKRTPAANAELETLYKRKRRLLNHLDSLERDNAQRQQALDTLRAERARLAQQLAQLEQAIGPNGDLHRRIRALDAERQQLIDTLNEYKSITIPRLRRQLAAYSEPETA